MEKDQPIKCVVLDVDEQKQRISLGIKQLTEDPWLHAIPERYIPGQIIKGKVTKLTNFGAFVELETELEGLLHISELADHKIDSPQDIVKSGDEIEVKILKVDTDSRKIGLSLRRARWAAEEQTGEKPEKEKPVVLQTVLSDEHVTNMAEPETEVLSSEDVKEESVEQASQVQQDSPAEPEVEEVQDKADEETADEAESQTEETASVEDVKTEEAASEAEEQSQETDEPTKQQGEDEV